MNPAPDLFSTALKMLAALLLVLGGLGFFFYFAKRVMRKELGGPGNKMIRVLASQYVGLKKNISLVEVPGAILVIGISGDTIRLLTKIEDRHILDQINGQQSERIVSSFSDHLNKFTGRFMAQKSNRK
jgi:flagellar biogenesis protein FliO